MPVFIPLLLGLGAGIGTALGTERVMQTAPVRKATDKVSQWSGRQATKARGRVAEIRARREKRRNGNAA